MLKKQQGISFIGFIMVLAVLVFFILVGMRLFPMYQEYYAVVQAVEAVAAQPNAAQETPSQLREALMRRFEVNYVSSVSRDQITVNRENGYNLIVEYEVRRPMFFNLDIVGKFEKQVNLLAP